jgi:hypothetical protein
MAACLIRSVRLLGGSWAELAKELLLIGRPAFLPALALACCYALPAIASRTAGTISRAHRATAVARSLSALRKMNPRAP